MKAMLLKVPLRFYRSAAGTEVVRNWLLKLREEECNAIGQDLMQAQFGWPVGMPLVRPLGDGLFEVRTQLQNTIARVFICFTKGELVALHGIIKKTEQTPTKDLQIARKRLKEVTN